MKKIIKNNMFGFVLGSLIFSAVGVCAATLINGKEVAYDNANSKLSSTNVQDAIDELYKNSKLKNRSNIVEAYEYNQTTGAENYCVTGDEDTCVETTCYENKTAGSCPAGTIIIYKLNENETGRFHVMYDNGDTLTMQSQRNTIYSTAWIDKDDYAIENTDGTTCTNDSCNDEGPITILNALESTTSGWSNVNTMNYTLGTTTFKTNAFTGCSVYNECITNTYTLPDKNVKARMITVQEAVNLGCANIEKTCPIWMYNYLEYSTYYNGTINDVIITNSSNENNGYWVINANSSNTMHAWLVHYNGRVNNYITYGNNSGARAVVEINK